MPKRTETQSYQKQRNEPEFDLRREVYRIVGVDLTDVPGVSAVTAHTIVSEIATDVSRLQCSAFDSWLGLCPEEIHQRRQSPLRPYQEGQESSFDCVRAGAQCLYQARLPGRALPPHEVEAWHASRGHSDGTTGAHQYHLLSTREPTTRVRFSDSTKRPPNVPKRAYETSRPNSVSKIVADPRDGVSSRGVGSHHLGARGTKEQQATTAGA